MTNRSHEQLSKQDSHEEPYAILESKTLPFIKGHRYRMSIIFPLKPSQDKMASLSGLGKEEWAKDVDRYTEILDAFVSYRIFNELRLDVGFWETRIIKNQTFTETYLKELRNHKIENPQPILIKMWFYTDKIINKKELNSIFYVEFGEVVGLSEMIYGGIMVLDKLKVLPNEITTKRIKIPLQPAIEKMMAESKSKRNKPMERSD